MHYTEHKAAGTEFIHSLHSNSTGTGAEYVALDPCDVNDKNKKKRQKGKKSSPQNKKTHRTYSRIHTSQSIHILVFT